MCKYELLLSVVSKTFEYAEDDLLLEHPDFYAVETKLSQFNAKVCSLSDLLDEGVISIKNNTLLIKYTKAERELVSFEVPCKIENNDINFKLADFAKAASFTDCYLLMYILPDFSLMFRLLSYAESEAGGDPHVACFNIELGLIKNAK